MQPRGRGVKRKAGADYSADGLAVVTCDGRGTTARFVLWKNDALDRAEEWLRVRGFAFDGEPLADAGAASLAEPPHASVAVASEAEPFARDESTHATSSVASATIHSGAPQKDVGHEGVDAGGHAEACIVDGPSKEADSADDPLAAAICRRAACARQLGAYWGFTEWIVWGFLNQTKVLMFFAAHAVDLIGWFAGPTAGAHVVVAHTEVSVRGLLLRPP